MTISALRVVYLCNSVVPCAYKFIISLVLLKISVDYKAGYGTRVWVQANGVEQTDDMEEHSSFILKVQLAIRTALTLVFNQFITKLTFKAEEHTLFETTI